MSFTCLDCGAGFEIPADTLINEIVGCPDCLLDYVIKKNEAGSLDLEEFVIDGEDWGE